MVTKALEHKGAMITIRSNLVQTGWRRPGPNFPLGEDRVDGNGRVAGSCNSSAMTTPVAMKQITTTKEGLKASTRIPTRHRKRTT